MRFNYKQRMPDEDEKIDSTFSIKDFYAGKNIFITGVTGFIGKVLLEKLLRSCSDVGTIYVLLRDKEGRSVHNRLRRLLNNNPFEFHFKDNPGALFKVKAIQGDITLDGLGISNTDRQELVENVHLIFHLAASVKFDAPLRENIKKNVNATKSLLQLSRQMKHLNCFIHVSTAFANCHLYEITEEVIPMKVDPESVIDMIKCLPDSAIESITPSLLESRPNTYTFTKAMAEQVVDKERANIPVAIVRPSIVAPARREPVPGWIDNINGPAGLGLLAALGILRTIDWNGSAKVDMVPVDVIVDALIAIGWHTAAAVPSERMQVYNLTTSDSASITWAQAFDYCRKKAVEAPSIRLVRPIIRTPTYNRVNPAALFLTKIFSHYLFAYIIDFVVTCMGQKRIMVKIIKKMHYAFDILKPFTIAEWKFRTDNVQEVINELSPTDQKTFDFDMSKIDWPQTCADAWMGCRRYLLKENDSNIPKALKKMKMIDAGFTFLQLLFVFLSFVLLFWIFI